MERVHFPSPSITKQLREAILADQKAGRSTHKLCKAAKVDPATMSRFIHGAGIDGKNIDKLGRELNLTLVSKNEFESLRQFKREHQRKDEPKGSTK